MLMTAETRDGRFLILKKNRTFISENSQLCCEHKEIRQIGYQHISGSDTVFALLFYVFLVFFFSQVHFRAPDAVMER